MRSRRLVVLLVVGALACGGDATSPTRRLADVTGTWTFTMASRAGQCTGAAGGGPLYASLSAGSYAPSEQGLVNFVDAWDVTNAQPYRFSLIGHMTVGSGDVEFRLWKQPLTTGSLLVGTLDAQNHFTGTLTDPIPGYAPNFVTGSCVFPVTGQKS